MGRVPHMPAHRKCTHDGPRQSNGACAVCSNARRKERRRANPEAVNAYNRERRAKNPERENGYGTKYRKSAAFATWYARNRPRELWKKAKQRADKAGRDFAITVRDVENMLAASVACPYTNVPYSTAPGRNPWAASLDRKDNTKGYTPDNVEITSLWWNLAKNSWGPDVIDAALSGLRSHKS